MNTGNILVSGMQDLEFERQATGVKDSESNKRKTVRDGSEQKGDRG